MADQGSDETTADSPQSTPGLTAAVTPKDLTVKLEAQRLLIEWQDGRGSTYDLGTLRRVCPCASCRTEREEQAKNPLTILKFDPAKARVSSAKLVGNYAIQFTWSDGHNTGIFDFRFLRSIDDDAARSGSS